jgi:DNA-binding transcriptional LysR family regulator
MPHIQPNLHHLELFYHVVKSGGITAATRSMPYGIQQPAVSGQISLLENELGVRLFQRRPFKTTPAGQELYDFLAPFFSRLADVTERIAGKTARHLRLVAPALLIRDHLPNVMASISKSLPELELTLIEAPTREVFGLLEREEVDLAICEYEGNAPAGVKVDNLISLPLILLLPPGVALPKSGIRGLVETQPLIRQKANTTIARIFNQDLAKMNLHWPSRMEVGNIELINAYVAKGLGVGMCLRVPGMKFPKGCKVVELPDFSKLSIVAMWRGKLHPLATQVLQGLRKLVIPK